MHATKKHKFSKMKVNKNTNCIINIECCLNQRRRRKKNNTVFPKINTAPRSLQASKNQRRKKKQPEKKYLPKILINIKEMKNRKQLSCICACI